MSDDNLLFDYMFLDDQEKQEENEELREENEYLKEKTKNNVIPVDKTISFRDVKEFKENVESIAADCGVEMEISYEESGIAINEGYTPEDYYEYKMSVYSRS